MPSAVTPSISPRRPSGWPAQPRPSTRAGRSRARPRGPFQTNILRTTRSSTRSKPLHYPACASANIRPRRFPLVERLETATPDILEDFHRVAAAEHAELVPYIQYPDDVPLRQWTELNQSRDWTAIPVAERRADRSQCQALPGRDGASRRLRPTDRAGRSPNAMFSLLAPERISRPTRCRQHPFGCHLPLIVPPGCWFGSGRAARLEVGQPGSSTIRSSMRRSSFGRTAGHPDRRQCIPISRPPSAGRSPPACSPRAAAAPRTGCERRRCRAPPALVDPETPTLPTMPASARSSRAARKRRSPPRRGPAKHPGDARLWQVAGLLHRALDDLAPAVGRVRKGRLAVAARSPHRPRPRRAAMEAGFPRFTVEHAHQLAPLAALCCSASPPPVRRQGQDAAIEGIEKRSRPIPAGCRARPRARLRYMSGERGRFTISSSGRWRWRRPMSTCGGS